MKIIYANILFYALILFGLVGAAVDRATTPFWQDMKNIKFNYDVIWALVGVCILVTIFGLLKRKSWAYKFALTINATFALIPLSIIVVTTIMFWQELNVMESIVDYPGHLLIGGVSFVFWWALTKSTKIKNAYNKRLQSTQKPRV